MRAEALESLPVQETATLPVWDDVAVNRALQSFFSAIESDDSLFAAQAVGAVRAGSAPGAGGLCTGDFVLRFEDASLAANRTLHFSLVEKLIELLREAGSADSLLASLCLSAQAAAGRNRAGWTLRVRLEARGNSIEQAHLRWGLGLAHVQQALLFTSRYLRQQIARNGD
jgi:hypothetical protein